MVRVVAAMLFLSATAVEAQLEITMVGNAGVVLSDGSTTLMVDLPYVPGAFGYMEYDPAGLPSGGGVVAVITHHHRDHFSPELVSTDPEIRVVGPPSVLATLPDSQWVEGDSIQVGAFGIIAVPTPHTDDHRSYRVRWEGLILHFAGDTEDPRSLATAPQIDLLFVTPWLSCAAEGEGGFQSANRRIGYHLAPSGGDNICGDLEVLPQGASFRVGG